MFLLAACLFPAGCAVVAGKAGQSYPPTSGQLRTLQGGLPEPTFRGSTPLDQLALQHGDPGGEKLHHSALQNGQNLVNLAGSKPSDTSLTTGVGEDLRNDFSNRLREVEQELQNLPLLPEIREKVLGLFCETDPSVWPILLSHAYLLAQLSAPSPALPRSPGSNYDGLASGKGGTNYLHYLPFVGESHFLTGMSSGGSPDAPMASFSAEEPDSQSEGIRFANFTASAPSILGSTLQEPSKGDVWLLGAGVLTSQPEDAGQFIQKKGTITLTSQDGSFVAAGSRAGGCSESVLGREGFACQNVLPGSEAGLHPSSVLGGGAPPLPCYGSAAWRDCVQAAILRLEDELRKTAEPSDAEALRARLRLLKLSAGNRDAAMQLDSSTAGALDDFWANQLFALWLLTEPQVVSSPEARFCEIARRLEDALAALRKECPLVVRNLAFATEIQSFGVIKTFDRYEFTVGQRVLLYAEVENLRSKVTSQGYHTKTRGRVDIFDAEGKRVAEQQFSPTEEYCRNQRRDFFVGFEFNLPSHISPGRYSLELTIQDLHSGKLGRSVVEFSIVADRRSSGH